MSAENAYCNANPQRVNHPPLNSVNKSPNQTGQPTSMNKQNNFHYSKNNNKPPMWTNRPPGANDYKKPAAPAANSSYKKDDKGSNALKPLFCPAVNATTRTIPLWTNLGIPFVIDVGRLGMQMSALIIHNEPRSLP